MAGKKAVETMWITEAEEQSYYTAEARSHGAIYRSRVGLAEETGGRTTLSMSLSAEPVSFAAKVMGMVFGPLIKASVRKAFLHDLQDIKTAAESRHSSTPAA